MAAEWDLESGSGRPCGLRSWSCWLVHERCMDERDGWRTHGVERAPKETVSSLYLVDAYNLSLSFMPQKTVIWRHVM